MSALQIVSLAAAVAVFMRSEIAINLMSRACRLPVRAAFWCLAVGSAGLVLAITQGYRPPLPVALLVAGIAVLLLVERRIRGLLRAARHVQPDRRA